MGHDDHSGGKKLERINIWRYIYGWKPVSTRQIWCTFMKLEQLFAIVYIFSLFCGEACSFNPIVLHHDRCCRKCQGLDAVLLSCRSVALGREVKVCNWIIRIIIFRLSFRLVLETDNLGHKLAASLFRRGCMLSLVSVAWIATKLCVCLGCQHICLAIS
jgi:hypothetical protein